MKIHNRTIVAFLAAAALPTVSAEPAAGASGYELYASDSVQIRAGGDVMLRHEVWDWFGDSGDAYSFRFQRTRLHLAAQTSFLDAWVQPQYVSMWGLPDAAVPAGKGPGGMGALYYLHNQERNPDSFGLHQAWLRFKNLPGTDTSLTLGRMAHSSGLEHVNPQDGKKFNTLKSLRLGDRLLSSFEWSAFARAFDGVRIDSTLPGGYPVSASWFQLTQGGWEKDFNASMEDLSVASVVITAPKGKLLPDTELQIFAHNYTDERNCTQRVDNTGLGTSQADIDIQAVGAHLLGLRPLAGGQWDYLLWGVIEGGDWYEQDHAAYALTAETGFQWTAAPLKPWLRVGYFMGSGDDDPGDGDHGTFFQMAPGTRKYQLFPYYDLQNNTSLYGQLLLFPRKDLTLRFDYALNRLTESNDRWYMGTGPTQEQGCIFGYIGRSSGSDEALSREFSLMLNYEYDEHLSINLFYAHVWGDAVIENNYPDDSGADYGSIELTYTF
ncbi:MAG: alginate export family protein [Opitutales bacterium]